MTKTEVMNLLKSHRNERGMQNWEKLGAGTKGLTSFGMGLTQLRKIAKQVGRDHTLAQRLWKTDNYDAKVIALLIDDPLQMTPEQAEEQVEEVGAAMLAHVFSSCDATLAKTPFVVELACRWIEHRDAVRVQCGYGLIYELSKDRCRKELTDEFFLECLQKIRSRFQEAGMAVRMAMGTAVMGIGKRNRLLNGSALPLAKALGPIDFDEGGSCEPFDIVKHLASESLQKKLGA